MKNLHPYNDLFLKGMIQQIDTETAPSGFVFNVMRTVEQIPQQRKQGFSSKQLLSVILLGAAASITIIFMVVVPGLLNLTNYGVINEFATALPSLTKLIYSFFTISEQIQIPNILGICLAVLILLLGVDALFRNTEKERKKHRNTLFTI
jgi:type II secretory pathway component PulF